MSLEDLSTGFTWTQFTKVMVEKIMTARSMGSFSELDANLRGMHLATGQVGTFSEESILRYDWLVDPLDGIIVDARFQLFGPSILIAAAEIGAEIVIGKNYEQARRITAELIEMQLRDQKEREAFFAQNYLFLNLVIDAIEAAATKCQGILVKEVVTPISTPSEEGFIYPGWEGLSKEEKLRVIDEVLEEQVRPYIELDEGGVKIIDLRTNNELVIGYEGACTSCASSIGTTLTSIQNILQNRVHPSLVVVPDLSALTFAP